MSVQFDRTKFRELILYVCGQCKPAELGAVKLHKVLYLSDMLYYATNHRPITGATYCKQQFGPVAQALRPVLAQLERDRALEILEVDYHGYRKREFKARRPADVSHFNKEELGLVDDVIQFVCRQHTAKGISDFTHNQVWKAAEMGEELPYFTAFGMIPTEITEEDVAWGAAEADRIINERLRPS